MEPTSRRQFLQTSAVLAAAGGANAAQPAAPVTPNPAQGRGEERGQAERTLPTVRLGPHQVTRLIIGGNPIYGHAHFNRILSRYYTDWHTPERVVALLRRSEEVGINTWQNSYAERTLEDLDLYRKQGGRMHWLCLGKPDWDQHPDRIDDAAKRKPIGIAPHGALAERLHRQNRLDVLQRLLERIRKQNVLVGLSAHNPELIELAEDRKWDVDYYMCCLYYLTRPRAELQTLLGKDLPLGEIYLPGDPPRMFRVIQRVKKPCLVYKVLAAGRRINSAAEVRQCFATALSSIKPTDALIVGMYQQQADQVGDNAALVRELCARQG
ncbi:MAG: twin-arginine translocation signal domain-containing protein [Gemmataceae bacterium]|nr:twin-arginine translocation signal domain-containing protein [Gemmataceae bacterium]MCI0737769.1 twin-arginine translocation signal domain-containing protein [Gemmataceae bacterium]